MNPWPFVTVAYVLTLGGTAALALASWLAMRRAEGKSPARPKR